MEKLFTTRPSQTTILDCMNQFTEKIIPFEIRTDRFTGRTSRILTFRLRLAQGSHDPALVEKSREFCPFCPGNIKAVTPEFPPTIVPEGRIRLGTATVLPNAFPYSRYCGVTVFSDEHYVPLDAFEPETLLNALKASVAFINRVRAHDPAAAVASINWNYMMAAGGGLVHPHHQVVVSRNATKFHAHLIHQARQYRKDHQHSYWEDLVAHEKKEKSRYLFSQGRVAFLSSFSPGGMFGEILMLFAGIHTLDDITDHDWHSFVIGLIRVLKCFNRLFLDQFNMTLLLNLNRDVDFCVQARLMPRLTMPPWGTSDVNYFEKGHDEIIVAFSPEDLAEEIRNSV
jgi:galactose-1-phosphate uridylyltransferase